MAQPSVSSSVLELGAGTADKKNSGEHRPCPRCSVFPEARELKGKPFEVKISGGFPTPAPSPPLCFSPSLDAVPSLVLE